MKESIAIIGTGLSGLACCLAALESKRFGEITLFDPNGIGGGASGVAAGLMHPFPGKSARLAPRGFDGIYETKKLIVRSEEALGRPVSISKGILRVAQDRDQELAFEKRASEHSQLKWLSSDETLTLIPGLPSKPGLFISEGVQVDTPSYLKGLWQACQHAGSVKLIKKKITSLKELEEYSYVIIANGSGIRSFPEFEQSKLSFVKGQLLRMEWPKDLPPLEIGISGKGYLAMHPDRKSCVFGATFEHHFASEQSDIEEAKRQLMPKVAFLFPRLQEANILDCLSAVRVTTPDHQPLIGQIDDRIFYLTALGSKGLLYHGLYGKEIIERMLR